MKGRSSGKVKEEKKGEKGKKRLKDRNKIRMITEGRIGKGRRKRDKGS